MIALAGRDARHLADALAARFPALSFAVAADEGVLGERGADVEILVSMGATEGRFVDRDDIRALPGLKWVQSTVVGVDHWLEALHDRPDVLLTNARGIHGPAVAEMAIFHMLALSRQARRLFRHQEQRLWDRSVEQNLLEGNTVGIVGMGTIGTYLARVCKALGMTVYGLVRTPREIPTVDEMFTPDQLLEVASRSDFLVLLIPLTPETTGLIDSEVFEAMKPTAFLINLARGAIVDEDALIRALENRTIAGAGLDAFVEESPRLPESSRFWDFETVTITPHLAGDNIRYADQALPVIEANLHAYLAGAFDRMINVVDR